MFDELNYDVYCEGRLVAKFANKIDADYFISGSEDRFPDCNFTIEEAE